MKKLVLFDIDHTLIQAPRIDRYRQALNNLHKLEADTGFDMEGLTDKLIVGVILEQHGWADEQIEAAWPELMNELDKVYRESFKKGSVKLLPGVRELLEALQETGITLGLITGNLESVAGVKLDDVGLWGYFPLGGFGNDPHVTRGDLVTVAVGRAGFNDRLDNVWVIGDTPRDIAAAHEAGITHSVGVANGYMDVQELIDAGAEVVLEDFRDTAVVLAKLGL